MTSKSSWWPAGDRLFAGFVYGTLPTVTSSPVEVPARPHFVYWDRTATVIALTLGLLTMVVLWGLSDPNYGVLMLLVCAWLPYVLGTVWLGLVVAAFARRRVRVPVLIMPVVIALISVAAWTDFASRSRFGVSRPSMDAYARSVPAPPAPATYQLTDGELEAFDTAFAPGCPSTLGTFSVVECRTIPGGYLFFTDVDDDGQGSGIAYLPAGPPEFSLTPFVLPSSTFELLGGPWYRVFPHW